MEPACIAASNMNIISDDCVCLVFIQRKHYENFLQEARQREDEYLKQMDSLRGELENSEAQLSEDRKKEVELKLAKAEQCYDRSWKEKLELPVDIVDKFKAIDQHLSTLRKHLNQFRELKARDGNKS